MLSLKSALEEFDKQYKNCILSYHSEDGVHQAQSSISPIKQFWSEKIREMFSQLKKDEFKKEADCPDGCWCEDCERVNGQNAVILDLNAKIDVLLEGENMKKDI